MATIYKHGKTWRVRIQRRKKGLPRIDYHSSGFDTKLEAEIHAKQKELELFHGKNIAAKNILFSDYYEEWVKLYKIDGKTRTDVFRRGSIKQAHILFKDIFLTKLNKRMYQKIMNDFSSTRSKSTVTKYHRYFKACFNNAIDEQLISINPANNAVIRGNDIKVKSNEDKFLNYEDAVKLKLAVLDQKYSIDKTGRNIIIIALETGMRFGEILGLTWDRINFNKRTLKIDRTWDYHYKTGFLPTKTKEIRTIAISDELITFLKEIKKGTNSKFAIGTDEHISNNGANHTLEKACRRANIKVVTMHALRHTHGSILLYKGFSIAYISKRLGHASISMTQDIYLHVLEELQRIEDDKIYNGILT